MDGARSGLSFVSCFLFIRFGCAWEDECSCCYSTDVLQFKRSERLVLLEKHGTYDTHMIVCVFVKKLK